MEIIIKFTQEDITKDKDKVIQKLVLLCNAMAEEMPKAKKESTKKSKEKTTSEDTTETEPTTQDIEESEKTTQYSITDLQKLASEKSKKIENGARKIKALLLKYNAEKFSGLQEKDYLSFKKDLEELV